MVDWVLHFQDLRKKEQERLNKVIEEAPPNDLGSLVRELRRVTATPIQLTVDDDLVLKRYARELEIIQEQQALIGRLTSYLSNLNQLREFTGVKPLQPDGKTIEFTLAKYDARFWVSETGDGISIWPQWGRDSEFRRIDSLTPFASVSYFVPLADLNQRLVRVEQKLVPILQHLTDYATQNRDRDGSTPKRFVTNSYSVGARGS